MRLLPYLNRQIVALMLLVMMSFSDSLIAQINQQTTCGISEIPEPDNSPDPHACDFGTYDINNCGLIYIAVNFHFFVNDDCSGNVGAAPGLNLTQGEAFQEAESILKRANNYNERIGQNMQYNQAFWGAPVTAPQCVPIRYVTNEIFIYCDSSRKQNPGGASAPWANSTSYPGAINTAVADIFFSSQPSVTGYTNIGARYVVVENFEGQNFHHEVGHTGTLQHTNAANEFCDDTPRIDWEYDFNNDSIFERNSFNNPCFDSAPFVTVNNVDYDQCNPDGTVVINRSPCCDMENRDNNTMVAGALAAQQSSRAAMTPCQVGTLVTNYFTTKCDMVRAVEPACPPASAFIGVLPSVDFSQDCDFTLYFEASMEDKEYRLTYELLEGNSYSRLFRTDWASGPATNRHYGVGRNRGQNGIDQTLLSNADYRITLETKNNCGEAAEHSIIFTTGDCDIRDDDGGGVVFIPEGNLRVFPNPTNQGSTLEYTVNANTEVDIYWAGMGTDGHYLPLQHHSSGSGTKTPGNYSVQFTNQQLKQGVNYIIIQTADEVHMRRVARN